jgi:Protein tyrosine and serine/threonine kinase
MLPFVKDVRAVRVGAAGEPPDVIQECDGYSHDLNRRFGGPVVVLVPVRTSRVDEAATHFELQVIERRDAPKDFGDRVDIAEGTSPSPALTDMGAMIAASLYSHTDTPFRFVVARRDPKRKPITSVKLLRSVRGGDSVVRGRKEGFDGWSEDLNRGRHADYLWLCWRCDGPDGVTAGSLTGVQAAQMQQAAGGVSPSSEYYDSGGIAPEDEKLKAAYAAAEAAARIVACTACGLPFDPVEQDQTGVEKCRSHAGEWHEEVGQCGVRCAARLLRSLTVGQQHWSCCGSADRVSNCPKTHPRAHVVSLAAGDLERVMRAQQVARQQVLHSERSDDLDRWLIDYGELERDRELASGNFGVVYAGIYNGNDCVIKLLKSSDASARDELIREARQLASLRPHGSICAFYGICIAPGQPLALVTEFIAGGNLHSYLLLHGRNLRDRDLLSLSRDLASGIDHLHKHNILHADVAARNCLIVSRQPMRLRICDFGLRSEKKKRRSTPVVLVVALCFFCVCFVADSPPCVL